MVVRWFLLAEAALFGIASVIHAGVLLQGYEHVQARTAETVIALVLLAGLLGSALAPPRARAFGLGAQAFALLGTLVGVAMIAIGVGPRTALDLTLHVTMVSLLVVGLVAAWRADTVITE